MLLLAVLAAAGCSDVFRPTYDYAEVAVRAVDDVGAPISGVDLTLYFGPYHHDFGRTRADGTHTFRFVPAGPYGIAAGAPAGYVLPEGEVSYRIVQVEKGGSASVEFAFDRTMQ